ncbi:MAG: TetR/AcrR family transcriptional regulator [Candidatus Marinimicrobia bacterium]|nr:TetR/AcrR family transcriptional regulator [Candidatus Neomarinimicrobiota bacterium]
MIQESSAKKDQILEQSFDSITQDGVRSFTVETLSQKLGMSKKTIYKFFPTKEILIEKSVDFFTGLIERKFKKMIAEEPNPAKQFVSVMQFIIGQVSRVPMDRVAELKSRYPKVWKKVEDFRLARRDDFYTILSEAQRQGYVREDIDVKVVATLHMNIVNSTFQPEFFINNNLAPAETIKIYFKMITSGLFTEQGMPYIRHIK